MSRYRAAIAGEPAVGDPEFGDLLRRSRAGDEAAQRAISGGHLRMAMEIVEPLPEPPAGLSTIDAVQEANAGLWEAIETFTGTTADEFEAHARRTIHTWLSTLDPEQV